MYDISLTMPAIRTNNWEAFYESAKQSCSNHSFELVLVSPFELPNSLKSINNITHILDKGNPSRCTQIANIAAKGKLIYNCVDDGLFFNSALDWVVDEFNHLHNDLDVINMRYRESSDRKCGEFPLTYWNTSYHSSLRLPGINPSWKLSLHFVMKRHTYLSLGGIDCNFEYSNHGIHDLMFRIQAAGGTIFNSLVEGLNCTHFPGQVADHGPINDAQLYHDEPIFNSIYSNPQAAYKRKYLDLDNWMMQPQVWERRFYREITKYEDLING